MAKTPKPSAHTSEIMTRRWTEQRWLLDNIIRSVGADWDQPRTISYNVPCGVEANADFAAIRARVQKFADLSPAFETAARRREARARAAEKADELVTARNSYFIAAVQYAASQWPYDDCGERNMALNRSVLQVARRHVKGETITEPMLNRVEAVIRCYDPCLSCSTHALGQMPLVVEWFSPDGTPLGHIARPG